MRIYTKRKVFLVECKYYLIFRGDAFRDVFSKNDEYINNEFEEVDEIFNVMNKFMFGRDIDIDNFLKSRIPFDHPANNHYNHFNQNQFYTPPTSTTTNSKFKDNKIYDV
jgi:hypothetical protein